MENITEPTSEAPAENTGADNTNAILSIEDLTSSFMGKVEDIQSEEQPTTDTVQEPDTAEAVDSEEKQEGDVLSQSDNDTEEDSVEESDDSYFFRVSKIGRLRAFRE